MAWRPRLLLYVAESDGHALVLHGAGASARSVCDLTEVGDGANRSRAVVVDTLQDQPVAVRLSDIKEEARAQRQHGQRFPSAPGDSR